MPEDRCINGINVTQLRNTIQAIKDNPKLGQFKFYANNQWVDGGHAFSVIKDFYGAGQENKTRKYSFILHADEPEMLLGNNYGPNPTETVLHALACCVGSALMVNAAAQGVQIDKMEFDVEGDIDVRGFLAIAPDVRKGLQGITMTCRISGDASESKLQELVKLGQEFSPVFDIVSNGVPITVNVEGQKVAQSM